MKGGMRCVASGLAAWALLIGVAGSTVAQELPSLERPVTLNFVDSGWYDSTGSHIATTANYIAGQTPVQTGPGDVRVFRNFFVFNLAGYTDPNPIGFAELRLFNAPGGYSSPDPTETYSLFDVTTPIPTLVATNTGRTDIFADLGSGLTYGSRVVSAADNNSIVSVALNETAVAALNANRGGLFALGGTLTTFGPPRGEFVFGFTGSPNHVRQLHLVPVPEPGGMVLLGTGLVGLLGCARRCRKASIT